MEAIHAKNPRTRVCRWLKKQARAMTISTNPVANIKCPNFMLIIGSTNAKIPDVPNALQTLAIPVMVKIAPQDKMNHRQNGLLVSLITGIVLDAIISLLTLNW